jgi:hypothetical protein
MMSSPGCCQPFEWISGPIGIDFYPNQLARSKARNGTGQPSLNRRANAKVAALEGSEKPSLHSEH